MVHVHRLLWHRALDLDQVGAGDGPDPLAGLCHPRHLLAVLEPDDQLARHINTALQPFNPPKNPRVVVARRHEVRDPHCARRGVPLLLEYESAVLVRATGGQASVLGSDQPPAIGGRPQQGREAGGGIKTRDTQPIDRAVPTDEGRRMGVADQGIILDALAHPSELTGWPVRRRTAGADPSGRGHSDGQGPQRQTAR